MNMLAFYEHREAIKKEIESGDGIWAVDPPMSESEIMAWIAYMEAMEVDLDQVKTDLARAKSEIKEKGGQLVRMIDRFEKLEKAVRAQEVGNE